MRPLLLAEVANLCRNLVEGADAAGVELDDGNVVDLCADNLPQAVTLSDIRCALVVAGLAPRFPKATSLPKIASQSRHDFEGYPGIAHDLETLRMQRDKLLAALKVLRDDLKHFSDDEKCEHDVGICWCGVKSDIHDAETAIAEVEGA